MKDEFLVKVGMRIKNRRLELGLSLEDLAIKIGYTSRSSVSRYETGDRNLTTEKLKKIADALEVSPLYLMGIEDMNENEIAFKDDEEEVKEENPLIEKIVQKLKKFPDYKLDIILKLIEQMGE